MWTWYAVSCSISMVVHMVLLVALGLIVSKLPDKPTVSELVATVEERPQEDLNQVLEQSVEPSKTLDQVSSPQMAGAMGALAVSVAPTFRQDNDAPPTPNEIKADPGELNVFNTTGTTISNDIPAGSFGDASQQAQNYSDAMDRMTAEILTKLTKSDVLLVWCFDQSESMLDDREEIMSRVQRVYEELGVSDKASGDRLLTAVTSYGADFKTHTPKPTSDIPQILSAMKQVPVDPSGLEMMCGAISYAVTSHKKFASQGGRQIMCIVVTDESGDPDSNYALMEQTIADCKTSRCPVYFLGRESVFGYPYVYMTYTDPTIKTNHWIRIDRGPETPFAEQLQVDGFHRRHDAHPSGFGPYVQTRISRQTGGIFFMLPSPETRLHRRDATKYEFDAMRPYLPDLSSRDAYAAERDKYEMRKMMWKVILDLNPYDKTKERLVQVRVDEWSVDPATFITQAKQEYDKAQKLIGYFAVAEKELAKVKAQRNREESFRWRANYDLTYAQTITYQVRLHEYCATIEGMAKDYKPPSNPKHNEWHIYTIAKTKTDAKTKKQRDEAIELLKAVVKDHAGTPYAGRAQYELSRGFGVELRGHFEDPRRKSVKLPKL